MIRGSAIGVTWAAVITRRPGSTGWHLGHPRSYFSPYHNPYLPDGPPGEYLTDRLTTAIRDGD